MELLKIYFLFFLLVILTGQTGAQVTQETMEQAFARSYELENKNEFITAVDELKEGLRSIIV
jgi:hypothetical protein